ncbi:hypothetical protein GWI33_003908 [Rhynchophorus ferrugineus]|uniref:Uncharacterized protein n=1 Tax=Rhynchophorus ferrugineus TaxID=354439 RepID=A0A834IT68_RHYFE|nr:hypothetical protein GWI33_003908 [Rhynchophorus ferrugineus]
MFRIYRSTLFGIHCFKQRCSSALTIRNLSNQQSVNEDLNKPVYRVIDYENDIDKELSRSLYSRIDGLEEQQLKISLKFNEERGLDTTDIRSRLKEIETEKQDLK